MEVVHDKLKKNVASHTNIEMPHIDQRVQPEAEIVPIMKTNPYKEFLVNVYTLARDLNPYGSPADISETRETQTSRKDPCWPLPLWITIKDTPKTISAKFKKQYGYSLDTLMLEPDEWKDDKDNNDEPKFFKQTGCQSYLRGSHKDNWVLRNRDWAIEVRMQAQ